MRSITALNWASEIPPESVAPMRCFRLFGGRKLSRYFGADGAAAINDAIASAARGKASFFNMYTSR